MRVISRSNLTAALRFVALLSVALYLVPTGAHWADAARYGMAPGDYMVVQRIYDGWALFGIAIVLAQFATLALALLSRHGLKDRVLTLVALLCLVGTQLVFWMITYPMNVASRNWTVEPPNFPSARMQWEHSHLASGALTFVAFICLLLAAVRAAER